MRYIESINAGLRRLLSGREDVYLLGEDLLDPYGGAFKALKGLSTDFPTRVISTPISEAGFVGLATGMALRGLRPVVEIMFGDFLALAADQIVNGASKFAWLYEVDVPLTIRVPSGGYRGYGPTHSQCLETLFLNVPGLSIVSPSIFHNPGEAIFQVVSESKSPTLFVESKYLCSKELIHSSQMTRRFDNPEDGSIYLDWGTVPKILIAAYGGAASLAYDAIVQVFVEHEIEAGLCIPFTVTSEFDLPPAWRSVEKVIIVEESPYGWGWSSEIGWFAGGMVRRAEIIRIFASRTPIPCSKDLEKSSLPSVENIKNAILGRRA